MEAESNLRNLGEKNAQLFRSPMLSWQPEAGPHVIEEPEATHDDQISNPEGAQFVQRVALLNGELAQKVGYGPKIGVRKGDDQAAYLAFRPLHQLPNREILHSAITAIRRVRQIDV